MKQYYDSKFNVLLLLILCINMTADAQVVNCPLLPDVCTCTHKVERGFRISCKGVEEISFKHLPTNISIDM